MTNILTHVIIFKTFYIKRIIQMFQRLTYLSVLADLFKCRDSFGLI